MAVLSTGLLFGADPVGSGANADLADRSAKILRAIVTAVVLLNLVDAVLTLFWVHLGIAREANLLLEGVLQRSAVLFMVVKMALVSLGLVFLWRHRERRLAVFGIALAFCAYASLFVAHLRVAAAAIVVV